MRCDLRPTKRQLAFGILVVFCSCAEAKPAARAPRSWSTTKTTRTPTSEPEPTLPVAAPEAPRVAVAPPAAPEIDPEVLARLDAMGKFLQKQRAFVVRAEATTDDILENGQKIQLTSTSELWIKRPDRLRIKTSTDRKEREMYYDGATFTLVGARVGHYARFEAPRTIDETIDVAEARYGIEIPVVDVFYWGTEKSVVDRLSSAISIGPSRVRGVATEQFALRQDDVDWQIWVTLGARPLPRKLVITTTSEPTEPQHVVMFDWTLGALLPDEVFQFRPPPGAHEIPFDTSQPTSSTP